MHKPEPEGIEFAEERRVFYVALTRTKNQVTLLCNSDTNNRSSFLDEITRLIHQKEEILFR
jgi:DNA helicase-4